MFLKYVQKIQVSLKSDKNNGFFCMKTNTSNCQEYAYIVKHNNVLGGMVFTVCKAQLLLPSHYTPPRDACITDW